MNEIRTPKLLSIFWIVSRFELERLFMTRRGLFYLFAFVFFWYLLLRYVVLSLSGFAEGSSDWSIAEYFAYWNVTIYFFPILCLFIAADQTGSDRERGSLRFLLLRCSRDQIYFGRFIAQIVIQSILVIATVISTMAVVIYRGDYPIMDVLLGSANMTLNLVIVLLPFIALMALLSAVVNSARQVTIIAALIWAMASGVISGLSHYWPVLDFLKLLIPGMQFDNMSALTDAELVTLAYIPILQCLALLLIGRFLMQRHTL